MGVAEILTLISIILLNGGIILSAWINVKVKLKEIDTKLENMKAEIDRNYSEYQAHDKWGKAQKDAIDLKFNQIYKDIKESNEKILDKVDDISEKISTFMVYCERKFKN